MRFILALSAIIILTGCGPNKEPAVLIEHRNIALNYDSQLRSRAINLSLNDSGKQIISEPEISEFLISEKGRLDKFDYQGHHTLTGQDHIGNYEEYIIAGLGKELAKGLVKKLYVRKYDEYPAMLVLSVKYINQGDDTIAVNGWVNNAITLGGADKKNPEYWSFNGASYEDRRDWILPVTPGFKQENYMGMNATDYGGGIPVTVVWNRHGGFSVGHLELSPQLVRLPVNTNAKGDTVSIAVEKDINAKIAPGDSVQTLDSFIAVHKGDFFSALQNYSQFMRAKGMNFAEIPASAYEPIWCAWGYERNFTVEQILQTLPKVKELGFRWAVLDDGWQTAEGDWYLASDKFPNGDRDMQALVQNIKRFGLRAKLWWAPLAADPGTDLHRDHADMLLINAEGMPQDISWWDSHYLCPAYEKTRIYTKKLVEKIMRTWGFEGLKIDGQHLNGVPPCYNPVHNHVYPEESVEQLPEFFEEIHQTAIAIVPDAVVEICPCGTAASFFNMPFMNQPVSSDPLSSWQIRLKGKTFKALMGSRTAYYGDHVELSGGGTDFASTVGIGAVVGTKFTWPGSGLKKSKYLLTPEKELVWGKWVGIYEKYRLSEGEYLGDLYDLGFDRPEAHAIRSNDVYYYAFYTEEYDGKIELRGLPPGRYHITNYEDGIPLGDIDANEPNMSVNFKHHLLLMAEKSR